MKLYIGTVSGNSYKVRILVSLLKIPCEQVLVDLATGEHKRPEFLQLNLRGEVPVLQDGDTLLWDSAACLVYLARKFGGGDWLPTEPAAMAEVIQWLALAGGEIQFGLQYGRRGVKMGRWTAGTLEQCNRTAGVALNVMENRLKQHKWLACDHPTIADVACFPYVETAPEGLFDLSPYPAVLAWMARCKALPGWAKR
jgi:glutathione S-transferase